MADVEYSDSDFAAAVAHLRDAGDAPGDPFCPALGVLGSAVVASALGDVDALVRQAMTAVAGVGGDLSIEVGTVHTELRTLDAQLAGAGG